MRKYFHGFPPLASSTIYPCRRRFLFALRFPIDSTVPRRFEDHVTLLVDGSSIRQAWSPTHFERGYCPLMILQSPNQESSTCTSMLISATWSGSKTEPLLHSLMHLSSLTPDKHYIVHVHRSLSPPLLPHLDPFGLPYKCRNSSNCPPSGLLAPPAQCRGRRCSICGSRRWNLVHLSSTGVDRKGLPSRNVPLGSRLKPGYNSCLDALFVMTWKGKAMISIWSHRPS